MKKGFQWVNDREKLLLGRARRVVYKSLDGGGELALHFYLPKDFREGSPRTTLLFFHGGAWDRGSVVQFAPQALYYVERGAIGVLAEYRHAASHPGSRPSQSYQDGRAAVRYLRQQAGELNLDPTRIVVVGGAAGGNIAGALALGAPLSKAEAAFKPPESRPDGAILLSTIFEVVKGGLGYPACGDASEAKLVSLSRYHEGACPPMLVVHGNADRLVPMEEATAFATRLERKKVPHRLVEFEGRDRDFFNLNVDPVSYEAVLAEMDRFLDEHGLLKHDPSHEGPHVISRRESDY
ncbi:MAG: alpha/beta hydrolase [Verrucomicrobiales bacterium]|nr:alpha/beta hydrolase [Verrucomicrobiales bacterium]